MSQEQAAESANDPETKALWQVRLNRASGWAPGLERGARNADIPSWAKGPDRDLWSAPGLVLWNDAEERLVHLRAAEALRILEYLQTTTEQQGGLQIRIPETRIRLPGAARRTRKPANGEQPEGQGEQQAVLETIDREVQLSLETAHELFKTLQAAEPALREIADEEEQDLSERLGYAYHIARQRARALRGQSDTEEPEA